MKIKHPDFITIKKSSIPGAGLGVFAVQAIKKGKRLGEYSGEQLNLGQFLKKKIQITVLKLIEKINRLFILTENFVEVGILKSMEQKPTLRKKKLMLLHTNITKKYISRR
jgi:hypothetical protein